MAEIQLMTAQRAVVGARRRAADLVRAGRAAAARRRHHQPISRSRIADAATSCASAATSPCTASCARTSWPPAAPRMRPGLARGVVHAEPGVLVLDFIEGRTFTPEDVRDPGQPDAAGRAGAALPPRDSAITCAGPAPMFWVFHVVRDYAHTLREAAAADLPLLADLLARAERARSGRRPDRDRVRPQRSAGRQLHRRRQAAVAGRLGICRLQLAAVRSRRPRLQQRAAAEQTREMLLEPISAGPSTTSCAAAPPP